MVSAQLHKKMLHYWLGLNTDKTFLLERAHRTMTKPRPGQNRAVIIRFLKFQDRERMFHTSKQRTIRPKGNKIFFEQDFSVESMKAQYHFNTVKKKLIEDGSFRGFQVHTCKLRILCNGRLVLFSTPKEAEDFLQTKATRD